MDLLMIRHAHDVRDQDGRRLSPLGRTQAAALATSLASAEVAELWASSSARAAETALEIASTLQIPVRTDPRVDEVRSSRPDDPGVLPPRERFGWTAHDDSEAWDTFLSRVSAFISELCLMSLQQHTVAVVTHSGVFDAVHEVLTGAGRRIELEIGHTGITTWCYRPGSPAGTWLLRRHNDVAHLSNVRLAAEADRSERRTT